jgi:hypothetical protein
VIVAGQIDLSIGSIYALCSVLTAMLLRHYGPEGSAAGAGVAGDDEQSRGRHGSLQGRMKVLLNDKDKMLLFELAHECSSAISDCMHASNAQGALDHWESLEKLNVIQHAEFDKGKISANSVIYLNSLNK